MKKILSVMLAIMMFFGALSITAAAEGGVYDEMFDVKVPTANGGTTTVDAGGHLILVFDFGSGSSKKDLYVYDAAKPGFVLTAGDKVTGTYYMLPRNAGQLVVGAAVELPTVKAAETDDFVGWYCYADKQYYVSGAFVDSIPDTWATANNGSRVVLFQAKYEPREVEGDTLTTILGVLTKVFGTMLGLFLFDGSSAKGIELVSGLLSNLI